MKLSSKIILIVILILGFLLRVVNINNSPPALYGDELTIGLDAHSLLKLGQDQLGNPSPLTFEMGAGRPAGYVYGSIPFVAMFGPSPLGVRSLSIFSGIGIILLLFYIGKRFFSEKVGLIASFLAAISIWDISLSRGGFEAHFALFLALLGVYLFLKASEVPLLYIFSALSFGLTFHTYPTYKLSLLLFIPLLIWYQGGFRIFNHSKKYLVAGAVVFLVIGLTALTQTFTGGSENRFSQINIFSKSELKTMIEQKVTQERSTSSLDQNISKYFHNKNVEYAKILIENYLLNFSADFLVLHGDRNPRHNMATMGGLYMAEGLLILIGLISFWQKSKKLIIFLLLWIVLSPVATAVVDSPHFLRSAFMYPPLVLLASAGFLTVYNIKNKLLLSLIVVLFIIQFGFFIQKLFFLSPNLYAKFWAHPAKLASDIVLQNKDKFDVIVLSDKIDSIEFAYPSYAKIEPKEIIDQNRNKSKIFDYDVKKFGNVYIGNFPGNKVQDLFSKSSGSIMYIGLPEESVNFTDYQILQGLDKMPAILIVGREQ